MRDGDSVKHYRIRKVDTGEGFLLSSECVHIHPQRVLCLFSSKHLCMGYPTVSSSKIICGGPDRQNSVTACEVGQTQSIT